MNKPMLIIIYPDGADVTFGGEVPPHHWPMMEDTSPREILQKISEVHKILGCMIATTGPIDSETGETSGKYRRIGRVVNDSCMVHWGIL